MDKCLVYGCGNTSGTNSSIQFFSFPRNLALAQKWLQACCVWNQNINLSTVKICSIHFDNNSYTSECKMSNFGYTKFMKGDAVPTLYLPQQIVYKIASGENNLNNQGEQSGVIIENTQHTDQATDSNDTNTKYEQLQVAPLQSISYNIKVEEPVAEEHRGTTTSHTEERKTEKMKKELQNLETDVSILRTKLAMKIDDNQKYHNECNTLQKMLNSMETKVLTYNEQKHLLSKVFTESQIKILTGKSRIHWSHDDMAIAYTIRHMSNKRCYLYLSKKLNMPLPGLSSIRRWQSVKKDTFKKRC